MIGDAERLAEFMRGRSVLALSGAGISTESGIPDYRGATGARRRGRPILFREFTGDPGVRARYWARSSVGYPRMALAEPNAGHYAVARMEASEVLRGVITQNVDRLHQRAGSSRVLELHGSLSEVQCMECGRVEPRESFQARLIHLNPAVMSSFGTIAPDGDADLPDEAVRSFLVPGCGRCSGVMRPTVIFFGENVPSSRVTEAFRMLGESNALLVLGSSLAVFSGFRFVRRAAKEGKPVAIVNLGATRGDDAAELRIEAPLGALLPEVAELLRA